MRQADHLDLIAKAGATTLTAAKKDQTQIIPDADLSSLFGIDIDEGPQTENKPIKVVPIKKSASRRKTKKSRMPAASIKKKIKADGSQTAKSAKSAKTASTKNKSKPLKSEAQVTKKKSKRTLLQKL